MPLWLIITGAILLFIAALLALPLHLVILYRDQVRLYCRVLFISVPLHPKKEKQEKEKKEKENQKPKKEKEKKRAAKKDDGQKKSASFADQLELIKTLVGAAIRKTGRHLRLKTARLHIRVATGDAAATALAYAGVVGAVAGLLEALDRVVNVKSPKRSVWIEADYLSAKPSADIKLVFTLRVIGALSIVFSTALAYIKHKAKKSKSQQETAYAADKERNTANG